MIPHDPLHTDRDLPLQTEGLIGPLRNIEMPLVRVLAAMEAAGIAVDVAVLRSVRVRSQHLSAARGTTASLVARPEHFALVDQVASITKDRCCVFMDCN